MLAYWWTRMRDAEDNKAKADAAGGYIRSEVEAHQAELEAKRAIDTLRARLDKGEITSDNW